MKIRTDFVTNSSSSSFIIAIQSDVTKEQINNYIEELIPKIIQYEKEYGINGSLTSDEIKEDLFNIFEIIQKGGMSLSNWRVGTTYVSNEDETVRAYIYDYGLPKTDWLKTEWGEI